MYELTESISDIGLSVNASVPASESRLFGTSTQSGNSKRKGVIVANNSGVATLYINLVKRDSTLTGSVSATNWLWMIPPGGEPILIPAGEGVDVVLIASQASGVYSAKEVL